MSALRPSKSQSRGLTTFSRSGAWKPRLPPRPRPKPQGVLCVSFVFSLGRAGTQQRYFPFSPPTRFTNKEATPIGELTRSSLHSSRRLICTLRIHPLSPLPSPATCCHGDDRRLRLRLGLRSQEAGEADDRAGHADRVPSPVQGPRAALLRGQAPDPLRRGGQRDVAAQLAVRRGGARGVPPEGRLQGARRVCGGGGGCRVVTAWKGVGRAVSRALQMHKLPGGERLILQRRSRAPGRAS